MLEARGLLHAALHAQTGRCESLGEERPSLGCVAESILLLDWHPPLPISNGDHCADGVDSSIGSRGSTLLSSLATADARIC